MILGQKQKSPFTKALCVLDSKSFCYCFMRFCGQTISGPYFGNKLPLTTIWDEQIVHYNYHV